MNLHANLKINDLEINHLKNVPTYSQCKYSAKFYLYNSTKIAKAGPGFDDRPVHPSFQINSSSPWLSMIEPLLNNVP